MANMIPISTVTVGSGGAASIDFTGIPQTYTDLLLMVSTRSSTTEDSFGLQFNGDTGNNYSYRNVQGDGTNAQSFNGTVARIYRGRQPESGYTANTFGNSQFYIPNYAGSNNKSVSLDTVNENNATTARASLSAALWSNTSPITSIKILPDSGNFVQYSSATLYGIRKY
jgi:hypothetical protein